MFELYPAIDIHQGRCVRLTQGDFATANVYDESPANAARRWVAEGATHLHVVDLDGAKAGHPVNVEAIAAASTPRDATLAAIAVADRFGICCSQPSSSRARPASSHQLKPAAAASQTDAASGRYSRE